MITAVDTNVLVDVITGNPLFFENSARALRKVGFAGRIVISDIVYAEVCCFFDSRPDCDDLLADLGIRVEALLSASSFAASRT